MNKEQQKPALLSGILVFIIVAVLVGLLWYENSPGMRPVVASPGPAFFGTLVGIGSTTITVISEDQGTMLAVNHLQKTYSLSYKTPVTSDMPSGEVGAIYNQLNIGENLSITADANDPSVAAAISVIPLPPTLSVGATAANIIGTIVSISDDSITIKPATNDPVMAITTSNITIPVTASTTFLTEVLGGQTGLPASSFMQGEHVAITVVTAGDKKEAQTIVLLRPEQ